MIFSNSLCDLADYLQKSAGWLSCMVVFQPTTLVHRLLFLLSVFLPLPLKACEYDKTTFSPNNYCVLVPHRTNPQVAWNPQAAVISKEGSGVKT